MPESCCCGAEGCPVCRPETVSRIAELEALLRRWLNDMNTTGPGDYSLAYDTEKALEGKQE